MNLIWNIIRKDLIRFRFPLLAWLLLLAGKYFLLATTSGVFGQPSLQWIRLLAFPKPLFLVIWAGPGLFAALLVAALIFEDSPANRDPFWVTRPISGAQLLSAKLILVLAAFVLLPLLAAFAWWRACGFGLAEWAPLAGYTAASYLLVALLALAVASVTQHYPRFLVWMVTGLGFVLAVHLIPRGGLRGQHPEALDLAMLGACLAVLAIEIACHRFLRRHFTKTLPLIAIVTLLVSAWLFNSPPAALVNLYLVQPRDIAGNEIVRVSVAGDVRTFYKAGLSLPLRVEGLPENAVPTVWLEAQWKSADGKVWPTRGGTGGNIQPFRQAARHVLRLPVASPADRDMSVNFSMAAKYAGRISTEAATVEGRARVKFSPLLPIAEIPAGNGIERFDGGSFTVSDYLVRDGQVSFLFTGRVSPAAIRDSGIGYLALVNRRTGEVIEPAIQMVVAGTPPVIPGVAVFSIELTFRLPDAKWLNDAHFVVLALGPRQEVVCQVPAFTRPSRRAEPLFPEQASVPPEILQQYVGDYRPGPGSSVSVTESHGNLFFKVLPVQPGMPKFVLFPLSTTRFQARYQSWIVANDGFEVEFMRDAQGHVSHFVVHEGEREYIVPRNGPVTNNTPAVKPEPPEAHPDIHVSPDILRQYVGTYQFKEITVFITLTGDHLSAHGTNLPEADLFAESETRFFAKNGGPVAEFVKDDKGAVTHFVAHENGHDTIVMRTSASVDEPPAKP